MDLLTMTKKGHQPGKAIATHTFSEVPGTHQFLSTRSKPKLLTEADISQRSHGYLPKIAKNSHRKEAESGLLGGINSTRNSTTHLRKFEFVVPQHKVSKPTERRTERDDNEEEFVIPKEARRTTGAYIHSSDVKAPYPFDMDDIIPNQEQDGDQSNSRSPKDEGDNSVIGTRVMAQTFTKVFHDMTLEGMKLPSLRK